MSRDKPIGIDLGTTNSAMAWVDESGRSQMVANAEGELITPSIVYFSESEVVVGKNARSAIVAHPDMVAQWVKRDMGAAFYSHPIRGHYLPPEVIQACVLRKLKADLTRALGAETHAVITVPAYFDELRRKSTADAGEMAGLRVLDIVNEPTAAALAFGEFLGYLANVGMPREEMHVMVYDLGGGTFDATLLHLATGKIDTIATDGDVQLGGHDWDKRLVDHAAEAFIKAHQLDPRTDPATLNRLYQDAMETKHTLSARTRATLRVEFSDRVLDLSYTREQFEEMTADLLERTGYTSRQLLAAAGLEWKDVKRILLVGGSTRMPMVSRMLKAMAGIEPDRTVNPDEAVARGAALYANYLLAKQEGSQRPLFQVTNVNAHSLGIEGIDADTLRKKNVILIPRNTRLPARHAERFCTKTDGQRSIVLKILEGESSLPGECIAIGRTVVRELPGGLPKGWPVEVTFEYGTNGRLMVQALVPGTQHHAKLELERDVGISGEGLARWKAPIAAAAGFDAFERAIQEAMREPVKGQAAGSGVGTTGGGWALADDKDRGARAEGRGGKVEMALPPSLAGGQRPPEPSQRPPEMRTQGPPELALPPTPPDGAPGKRPPEPSEFLSAPQPLGMPVMPGLRRAGAQGSTGAARPLPPTPPAGPSVSQAPDASTPLASAPSPGFLSAPAGPSEPAHAPMSPLADILAAAPSEKKDKPTAPAWMTRAVGHAVAALLGVLGGLAIVKLMCAWRPDLFTFFW